MFDRVFKYTSAFFENVRKLLRKKPVVNSFFITFLAYKNNEKRLIV